jgi:hypothetical protein
VSIAHRGRPWSATPQAGSADVPVAARQSEIQSIGQGGRPQLSVKSQDVIG